MSIVEKEFKKSKCQTGKTKSISLLWSGLKPTNSNDSQGIYKKISLNLDNPSSSNFKHRSESVRYITNAYLSSNPIQKSSSNANINFTSNNLESIQAIFNNKYYSNDVKTKLYGLPNNAVIKNRFIQRSLIGDDPRYYHMKKMVRFWDCFCNYVCPKITIDKFLASKQSSSDVLRNNGPYYHSTSNSNPIKLTRLPILYTNSSSSKTSKKHIKKIKSVNKVYSNMEIKRVSMGNE